MSITSCVERITPMKALEYLETNAGNQRNVTASHELHLRQQMKAGQWQMTGEPIIFDSDGRLVDGQHRLRALVSADVTLDFMVVRGVESESFMVMNRGKTRTAGNIFAIHGVKSANAIAACVSGVLNYRRAMDAAPNKAGGYGSLNSYVRPSTTDMISEYNANEGAYTLAINLAATCRAITSPSVVSVVAAASMIDGNHHHGEVDAFWRRVGDGVGLAVESPALLLRNIFIGDMSAKAKLPKHLLTYMAIKAWNLHYQKQTRKIIRMFEGEGCPKIIPRAAIIHP